MDSPRQADHRASFLIAMYNVMWDNINRHILVVWQSVTALVAALAGAYLTEKQLINAELAATLVILTVGWSLAQTVDARVWFNRNLLIIANIERQLLDASDCREVHHYFCRPHHRGTIDYLIIQAALGYSVGVVALSWHFLTRVAPGFASPVRLFDAKRAIPYVTAAAVLLFVRWLTKRAAQSEIKLAKESPGKPVAGALAPTADAHEPMVYES